MGRFAARAGPGDRTEHGYTLIELLVVSAVLPLVIGAIAVALVSVFTLQGSVSNRLTDSADAQTVSATYEKDVQSAVKLTTNSAANQCGSGTQLLGLEWSLNQQTGRYQTVVSYVEVQSGSRYSLVRQYCASGAPATPTTMSVISSDLPANQPPPVIAPSSANTSALAGFTSTAGVTGVTIAITEPKTNFSYRLVAIPRISSPASQIATVATPTTGCGFAAAGTGTYASTVCFVDFTPFVQSPVCQPVTAGIGTTAFTMSFCVLVTGGAVPAAVPAAFPTYPGAFLGNNGFYTGVPGKPALYQPSGANGTTTTVQITHIQVVDGSGNPATGWQFVSGDAETTDATESLTWTSNQNLNLLPNTPTSPIGNACQYSPAVAGTYIAGTWLTGIGTPTVECAASVNSNKSGTVMLEAAAPTSLTVTMVGSGLQGIFVGLYLPG